MCGGAKAKEILYSCSYNPLKMIMYKITIIVFVVCLKGERVEDGLVIEESFYLIVRDRRLGE
jgi:hypothetical protein